MRGTTNPKFRFEMSKEDFETQKEGERIDKKVNDTMIGLLEEKDKEKDKRIIINYLRSRGLVSKDSDGEREYNLVLKMGGTLKECGREFSKKLEKLKPIIQKAIKQEEEIIKKVVDKDGKQICG